MHCRTGKKSPFLRLPSERPAHPSRQRHGPAPSAWGAVAQQTTAVAVHGEPGKPGTVKQLWHTGHPQREELLTDIEQLCFILYIFIYLYISLYRQERFCPFYCFYIFLHSFTTLSPTSQGHISTSTSLVFVSKLPHVQGMFMFVETSPATAATLLRQLSWKTQGCLANTESSRCTAHVGSTIAAHVSDATHDSFMFGAKKREACL